MKQTFRFKLNAEVVLPYEDFLSVLAEDADEAAEMAVEGFYKIIEERFGAQARLGDIEIEEVEEC